MISGRQPVRFGNAQTSQTIVPTPCDNRTTIPSDTKRTRAPGLAPVLPLNVFMRHKSDHRPGAVPMIRTVEGSLTYTIVPAGARRGEELVIRCDDEGEVWVSIQPAQRDSR